MEIDKEFYDFLLKKTISWILKNRNIYRPLGKELDSIYKEKFKNYFEQEILQDARIFSTKIIPEFDFLDEYGFTEFTRKILNLKYKKFTVEDEIKKLKLF